MSGKSFSNASAAWIPSGRWDRRVDHGAKSRRHHRHALGVGPAHRQGSRLSGRSPSDPLPIRAPHERRGPPRPGVAAQYAPHFSRARRIFEGSQPLALLLRSAGFVQLRHGSPNDQAKILRQLLATVKMFEPRLANVRIVPLESSPTGIQELRVRIEGMLLMDPAPEPVSFDTFIELKSGICRLSGGANAG